MWVVAYGISIQTACHLISSWQFLWANHSENESAWIWSDRSQPGRYSSWQCVCTATVANADCNACWVANIIFLFCLVHIIGTQREVFLRKNYTVFVVNHITCPISWFTLTILHWNVKNLKSLAFNPMTTHHWIGFVMYEMQEAQLNSYKYILWFFWRKILKHI